MPSHIAAWSPGKVDAEVIAAGAAHWGGKGLGLMQMCADGLPVPPGFTISTGVCRAYQKNPAGVMAALKNDVPVYLDWLKEQFGYMPLVSVRSGARVSMPGMMDTVLNVGLTDSNLGDWHDRVGSQTASDSYIRLAKMYNEIVLGKKAETGFEPVPQDPVEQVLACIAAVFRSWDSPRAAEYRKLHGIPNEWGTAVNVQAMVFGNAGPKSGTGVLFTRNPTTGANELTGEYLPNAQGEDVVAGLVTPLPLVSIKKEVGVAAWNQVCKLVNGLEAKYRDMQDVEFTFQAGKLWLLQTRSGKRTAQAAFKIADDMVEEGVLALAEARKRVSFKDYLTVQRPVLDAALTAKTCGKPVAKGIGGSPGPAVGRVAFNARQVADILKAGDPVILVRRETSPDDIAMMAKSAGVLTATGGFTSHAAVVARGMNIPCVTGCAEIKVPAGLPEDTPSTKAMILPQTPAVIPVSGTTPHSTFPELTTGAWITLDGATGDFWLGKGAVIAGGAGVANKFLARLAADKALMLRTPRPESRAYCVAAGVSDLAGWAVEARKVEGSTLDLRGLSAWSTDEDAAFLDVIGNDQAGALAAAVDALCAEPAKEDVTVVLPEDAHPFLGQKLIGAGFKVVRTLQTLNEAFESKGIVVEFGAKLSALAGGDKGLSFLRSALEDQGVTFMPEGRGVAQFEAAKQLLEGE